MLLKNLYKKIPKVDELLSLDNVKEALELYPREVVLNILRNILNTYREMIRDGKVFDISFQIISHIFNDELRKELRYSIRKVINATGVIVHTNLGRSKICEDGIRHMIEVAENYSNLEYDLEQGSRGNRYSHVEGIICRVIGCESALVVNNNAAAIMIVLDTLCRNTEVIVSRGELVEIGGSFRIPDVMKFSGAILKEVGCTNRTHLFDYENEINDNTSAFLKVHSSNYYIGGFTKKVSIKDLSELKEKYRKIIIEDIGSGSIIDLSKYGIRFEGNLVQTSLMDGADIVTFSGDKMLGGPQAGIIVGKKHLIDKIKKNHLLRALRVDKFILASLESTFRCYLDEKFAIKNIPTLKMITYELGFLKKNALELLERLNKIKGFNIKVDKGFSIIGGGSMPREKIGTYVLLIKHDNMSVYEIERRLRNNTIPIIVRIEDNFVKLDVRTIEKCEFDEIYRAFIKLEC
ncbi:L-seryl-tRNA(Sec) selenium transferase [Candidatus Arthromitus sp. SFB-mouse-Japan]|uniref:L-seryl-tRNA(Sec) selenium transferase n=1 Tax=Candidatus Arthromitus sp. SFB-mouse TaxID=49118 RepID=UPI00021B7E8B|nr:L-seryl-tRNA(Sec) selenium transferase [Candidatus Arthromitus sp. SFB-mouse]EIA22394.1 L-seryl-tRNA(Sec) selenium transferase [Candidatus Arthromitus sp. SFB-1]EIA25484.1 L-seryl-tRNA(Sec) selenium transferase [Candidatus Arthromitus sp. SFB-3]EIA27827.1 L-seryl-tRNA(Sec) selenium transferase [Candidatus Arthromitus sp. SFB-co]EIA28317.1 L-seryl-tRNA(Sec) selenium transferase [Candidatus Arthromitus sp. SFB-4]EIA30480.1 L-seryl-tRNA(Sec) selenium transferase [Candidatus Arthromitus sp. SFB